MTGADGSAPVVRGGYPWHTAPPVQTGPVASVQGARAGFVTRALANVADLLVVLVLLAGGYMAVAATRYLLRPVRFQFPAPGVELLLLLLLGLHAAYFAVMWSVVGRTYGDRVLGLRVVDGGGARLHWGRAGARALLCVVFPIGLFWVLVSRENRSVQDLLLRTSVVYDWSVA
jgi:uncharacterized RDD family membrane protein YckC